MEMNFVSLLFMVLGLSLFANFFGTLQVLKNVTTAVVGMSFKIAMMAIISMKKTHVEYRTKRGSIILAEEKVAAPNQARQGSVFDGSAEETVTGETVTGSVVDEDFSLIGKAPRQGHTVDGQTVTHSLPSKGLRK